MHDVSVTDHKTQPSFSSLSGRLSVILQGSRENQKQTFKTLTNLYMWENGSHSQTLKSVSCVVAAVLGWMKMTLQILTYITVQTARRPTANPHVSSAPQGELYWLLLTESYFSWQRSKTAALLVWLYHFFSALTCWLFFVTWQKIIVTDLTFNVWIWNEIIFIFLAVWRCW